MFIVSSLQFEEDFKFLYPNKESALTTVWNSIKPILLQLMKNEIRDDVGKMLLGRLVVDDETEEGKIYIIFKSKIYLFVIQ